MLEAELEAERRNHDQEIEDLQAKFHVDSKFFEVQ